MKITSGYLRRTAIGIVGSAALLAVTQNVLPFNQQQQKNTVEQTSNPIKDYEIPFAMGLLGIGVGAGAIVKRRQEKVQAAKEAKQSIIERERLIMQIKFHSKYGLNYTGDMKETEKSIYFIDLLRYVDKMNEILRTKLDTKSSQETDKNEQAKYLMERAKKLTELVMECVVQNGCSDYSSNEFRKLNLMSRFFQYLSDSSYNECDNITKLNIALNVFSFDNTKPSDETLKIVDAIESKALKELSEKLYTEAKKALDKRLSKSEIETLITTKLGTLCSLIYVEVLSKMMVQNAYTERDVLNRLAHTLAVTPWYELSGESFQ